MYKLSLTLFLIVMVVSCAGNPVQEDVDINARRIKISFDFNSEDYPWMLGKKYPQMSVWVRSGGAQPKTVFVTEGAGENKWVFTEERPGALPVWTGVRSEERAIDIDAVSAATPSGQTYTITWEIPDDHVQKTMTVYLEANVSFDYNEFYTKKEEDPGYSGVNGQPSIVWAASFEVDETPKELTPEIIGHGHLAGADHGIDPDMGHVTTAADLFDYIIIEYIPGS